MKDFLSTLLAGRKKQVLADLANITSSQQYGLNVRSTFPLPPTLSTSGQVRYESRGSFKYFSDLNATEQKLVQQHFHTAFTASKLPQALFAEACLNNATFVHLQESTQDVITMTLGSNDTNSVAYILIVAQANTKNSMVIQQESKAPTHTIINVVCLENSELELIVFEPQTSEPHFSLQHSTLGRNATLKTLQIVKNIDRLQTSITSSVGAHAHIAQNHIVMAKDENQHDIFSRIVHTAERGISQMNSKVILHDKSQVIYRGLVDLEGKSLHTVSTQKEHTLLLSPHAKIDVVPMLEIINDTISCTHSASISNLDREQLFYLQSRGFSDAEAEEIIIQGFLQDVLNQFSSPAQEQLSDLY